MGVLTEIIAGNELHHHRVHAERGRIGYLIKVVAVVGAVHIPLAPAVWGTDAGGGEG